MTGTPLKIAVVGAGITGLAAAHRLITRHPSVQVTVLEASDRIGGIIQTVERDGFTIELGPDSFITNKPGGLDLCRDLNFTSELIPTDKRFRKSLVLRNGKPLPVPEGFMLMAPSNVGAILTTPILSWQGKLRLLWEAFVPRRKTEGDESLSNFVRRRFGQEALERLVQPLVGGIYTSDPEKLSIEATLPRFPEMERTHGSVIRATLRQGSSTRNADRNASESGSGARYGLFVSARHGLGQLIHAVADACRNSGRVQIENGRKVLEISQSLRDHKNEATASWQVSVAGEHQPRSYDAVLVTLPAWMISRMLPRDEFRSLRTALEQIEYASSAIVVSIHKISDFDHPMDAFGLVIPDIEKRDILAVSFSSRKFEGRAPDGTIVLRTFVGGAMQPHLLERTDEEILAIVNRELKEILGMRRPPGSAELVRYPKAMPQYHVGHLDRILAIEREVLKFPGLAVCGSSFYGVGIPDSITSGRQEADRILGQLENSVRCVLNPSDG
ncbi:MAG: protoporphyrinogen oxidase [Planctomyces sp.]|nr:protoporphyrinogen oxidase [Planctomyces sp.]